MGMQAYLEMSEGDSNILAQFVCGWVGDNNRHNSREDVKGGLHTVSIESCELLKELVRRGHKVLVSHQSSLRKTCKSSKLMFEVYEQCDS